MWCKRTAQGSPKPQISDHTRTDLLTALWCNGNTSDSDSGITGSNPVRAASGHSYNGYYSRLLICQIRVRISGGPSGSID